MDIVNYARSELNKKKFKLIFLTLAGSHLYGTNTEDSDRDYIGVFIPTEEFILGFQKVEEIDLSIKEKDVDGKNTENAVDIKVYEIRKFIKLALDNNPNILELLFVDNPLYFTPEFEPFLNHAKLFPYQGLYTKFMGYANSQKKKMQIKLENYNTLKKAEKLFFDLNRKRNPKRLLVEFKKELKGVISNEDSFNYKIADIHLQKHFTIKKCLDLINNRIERVGNREDLILKHGYDTKFCMHTIRLLTEGIELLTTGELKFPLNNSKFLKNIKEGKHDFDKMIRNIEFLEDEMRDLEEDNVLPKKQNFNMIQDILISVLKGERRYK